MWGASAITRMAKGLANITIHQSENISKRLVAHDARKAEVEIHKTNSIASHKAALDLKAKLAEKLLDATPEERLRLRRDIEYLEQDVRQIGIYKEAVNYLPLENLTEDSSEADLSSSEESNQVWLDVFNDYARRSNESWRADLLARALALEAQAPGTIGQRALWFIGVVDEKIFHTFAALLDVSSFDGTAYLIPEGHKYPKMQLEVAGISYVYTIAHAVFDLSDLGLIGDADSSYTLYFADETMRAQYGTHSELIHLTAELAVKGIIFTQLAQTIAKLYEPKHTKVGEEIYLNWITSLKSNKTCIFEDAE